MSDQILSEAIKAVKSRMETYGHPIEDFDRIARMWTAIFGRHVETHEVALCMVAVKISRLVQTPGHHDSLVDIAGYAETAALLKEPNDEQVPPARKPTKTPSRRRKSRR